MLKTRRKTRKTHEQQHAQGDRGGGRGEAKSIYKVTHLKLLGALPPLLRNRCPSAPIPDTPLAGGGIIPLDVPVGSWRPLPTAAPTATLACSKSRRDSSAGRMPPGVTEDEEDARTPLLMPSGDDEGCMRDVLSPAIDDGGAVLLVRCVEPELEA